MRIFFLWYVFTNKILISPSYKFSLAYSDLASIIPPLSLALINEAIIPHRKGQNAINNNNSTK